MCEPLVVARVLTVPWVPTNSNQNERRFTMSRTFRRGERHIRARGIRQDPPDLRRLARALIALAEAQAEKDAQTQGRIITKRASPPPDRRPGPDRKDAA